jgi:uncharacterized protein
MSSALVVLSPPLAPEPAPWFHLVPGERPLALVVNGSQVFEIEPELFAALEARDGCAEQELRHAADGFVAPPNAALDLRPPTAISLNIAQSCNLACSYCYADEGRFGGKPQFMPFQIARAAIDTLLAGARGRRVTVGFIGGEPFLNRPVLHESVAYAARRGSEIGATVEFSVTTNATLLAAEDLDLLRQHAFAVSVSLDGSAEMNDRERHSLDGSSAAATALARVQPLLSSPGRARIAARATLTRRDLRVAERIAALAAAGFHDIGVSPMRTSPLADQVLRSQDWPVFLSEMIRAAEAEWRQLECGADWRFSNLATVVKQIHAGAARALPCGAGDNYVSVDARGEYFACHRTLGDERFHFGAQPDDARRRAFLAARQVDSQEPCRSCWARYLCGGGCHAEVAANGRAGCDFIRDWLDFCLRFYDRVSRVRPDLLAKQTVEQSRIENVVEVEANL